MVTGICVKAWQSKSGTGYNEEGNSPKVNNLGKLAINELLSSKLIVRKKHHQRMQLNSGIDKVRPYNSDTTVTKKEAELSASFLLFIDVLILLSMYNPHSTKIKYPENTDAHYLVVKKNDGTVFDENYPYINRSKGFRFKQFWVRVLLTIIVFPMCIPYMGLRIKNRKVLKKYKDQLKDGAITVSNHVHMWDYIAVMKAIRPRKPHVLVWAPNVRGESGPLVRLVGGIPIPDGDLGGKVAFNKAVDDSLDRGEFLQIYAEGSMWECYPYIRPFKLGAASLACRHNKPILPIGFSFRKPSWIRKHIFGQEVAITLTVGEPIFPDESLKEQERRIDLTIRAHNAVCYLADVDPKENPYEPIFNNSKRIDIK